MTNPASDGSAPSRVAFLALRVQWRSLLRVAIGANTLACVLIAGVLAGCQERLIYFPPRHGPDVRPLGPPVVEVVQYSADGGQQQSYYIPPRHPVPDGRIWMVFGGNGSSAIGWGPFAHDHPDDHAGFLLCDYPGYGCNPGSPSPQTMRTAMDAAAAALATHLGITEEALSARVGVFGHSLGCAIGLEYAARHPVAEIVLVAPFTDMLSMARRLVGWPLCEVLMHRYDNAASLGRIIARGAPPITIIHGASDEVIPVAMGRTLAARWPASIRYLELPGMTHNGILDEARDVIYAEMRR